MNTFWPGLLKKRLFEAGTLRKSKLIGPEARLVIWDETWNATLTWWSLDGHNRFPSVSRVTQSWKKNPALQPVTQAARRKIGCFNGCSMLYRYKNEYERITNSQQLQVAYGYTQYAWWNPQWCVMKSPWSTDGFSTDFQVTTRPLRASSFGCCLDCLDCLAVIIPLRRVYQ